MILLDSYLLGLELVVVDLLCYFLDLDVCGPSIEALTHHSEPVDSEHLSRHIRSGEPNAASLVVEDRDLPRHQPFVLMDNHCVDLHVVDEGLLFAALAV